MLKWLFFDVGGTLLDEEPVYRFQEELILEIINSHGLAVGEKEFASAVRAARRYYLPSYVSHLLWIFTEDAEKFQDVSLEYEKRINKKLKDGEVEDADTFLYEKIGTLMLHADKSKIDASKYTARKEALEKAVKKAKGK